jgi:hypothetical protein
MNAAASQWANPDMPDAGIYSALKPLSGSTKSIIWILYMVMLPVIEHRSDDFEAAC